MCATVDAGAGGGPTCERRLRVLSLTVQPGCWVDVSISVGQVGTLSLAPRGRVGSVAFGAMAFRGVVLPGGGIELCAGTQFDWSDGCRWTSAQYVTGRLADPRVTFTYAEAPAPGQAGCAPSCSASAELRWGVVGGRTSAPDAGGRAGGSASRTSSAAPGFRANCTCRSSTSRRSAVSPRATVVGAIVGTSPPAAPRRRSPRPEPAALRPSRPSPRSRDDPALGPRRSVPRSERVLHAEALAARQQIEVLLGPPGARESSPLMREGHPARRADQGHGADQASAQGRW